MFTCEDSFTVLLLTLEKRLESTRSMKIDNVNNLFVVCSTFISIATIE